jgi:hypothetical protein
MEQVADNKEIGKKALKKIMAARTGGYLMRNVPAMERLSYIM